MLNYNSVESMVEKSEHKKTLRTKNNTEDLTELMGESSIRPSKHTNTFTPIAHSGDG